MAPTSSVYRVTNEYPGIEVPEDQCGDVGEGEEEKIAEKAGWITEAEAEEADEAEETTAEEEAGGPYKKRKSGHQDYNASVGDFDKD